MKNATFVSVLLTLLIASLFFAVSAGPALTSQGSQIQANSFTASQGIQPYMTMNTNITWSTFNNGWSTLEYNNSTANKTLNAGMSRFYSNPITVNPQDIQSTAFPKVFDKINLYNKSLWNIIGANLPAGTVQTVSNTTHSISLSYNESDQGGMSELMKIPIPITDLPSNNNAFDYITVVGNLTAQDVGMGAVIEVGNNSIYNSVIVKNQTAKLYNQKNQEPTDTAINSTSTFYASISLKELNLSIGTNDINIGIYVQLPKSTNNHKLSITISDIAITSNPMTLGDYNNTQITGATGNAYLQTFSPDFSWQSVTNNGYSVATSQPLLNTTISQTAISNGSYIEEVQTQGQFKLPSAPDLTYGSANITEQLNVSSSQVLVLDINGLSYLSSISGKNGTINLIGSVNPTSSTSFIEIVEYTSSQWNSISGPPGFFSVAGVEYYFDEIVLGLTALLGIGGAAAHRRAAQLRRVK